MEKLSELFDQAKEMSQLHGAEWSSALCESGVGDNGKKHHAIISDSKNDLVIDTGSDSMEASWLCDYLELCSPANILAIAEAFRDMEKRASNLNDGWLNAIAERDEARAKLAEMEKQEPAIEVIVDGRATDDYMFNINKPLTNGIHELFTRPAPAADLAELVPDKLTADGVVSMHHCGVVEGWNDCCDAILRNIEEAGKKH